MGAEGGMYPLQERLIMYNLWSDLDSFIATQSDGRPAHAAYCSKLEEGVLVIRL